MIVNKNEPYAQALINKGLGLFIDHQILQFDNAKELPIHFIGSIAYYLKTELESQLISRGLKLGRILKNAWKKISPETLENLFFFMPGRIKAVLDAKGHFPVK